LEFRDYDHVVITMQYWRWQAVCGIIGFLLAGHAYASLGDRLDDFKDCLAVSLLAADDETIL